MDLAFEKIRRFICLHMHAEFRKNPVKPGELKAVRMESRQTERHVEKNIRVIRFAYAPQKELNESQYCIKQFKCWVLGFLL